MKIAALIPAFNEEATIERTVKAVQKIQAVGEITVINDGSTDGTATVLQSCPGIKALHLPVNVGKGGALNKGLQTTEADFYLFLDADLGETARFGQDLLTPLLLGDADMVVARFHPLQAGQKGGMGFGFVRRIAAWGIRFLTGQTVISPLSGQRAISLEVLNSLGGVLPGFGVEIGLTVGALRRGFRVLEIPLPMQHRGYGRGLRGFQHRGRQLLHVLQALWHCWRRGV